MRPLNPTQLVILACLMAAPPTFGAQNALSLRVTPLVAAAPATVFIRVTVEPDEKNRALVVEDDSETYYRSSEVQLEGQNAARTQSLWFRGLPPGHHRIRAAVYGPSGLRTWTSTTVTITGLDIPD